MRLDPGLTAYIGLLIAWPALAAGLATKFRIAEQRKGAVLFAAGVALVALTIGFGMDYQLVRSHDASTVGPYMILFGLAFTPPTFVAARIPARFVDVAEPGRASMRSRVLASYGTICVSAALAVLLGVFVGITVCQGGCL